ncbi:MAG: LLM class flavin-dependent oxidoreductase [Chloroflexi bacterium]|jgi:alkanesulfonate monooxygenase SsuD/methylene tetrahydromethanopterin reductase-like flavin-dependent oxidoreductase (luciferase family)|nr:LLM class flavin-dependent oxidoreductase [Chloroflexota bacterium]
MKFGVALPYGSARTAADLAQLAETAGWDGCFLGDAIWCEDPMIALTAAAMATQRIRLGTMVIPAPLRRPWKLASESLALERLSEGRLTLGLGAGAVWMGWQGFSDVVTDTKARAEMLDETIDLLTLFYQRKPFDYDGQHYHVKLSLLDERYYPPRPVQRPRIPLWVVGIWPRMKSMRRVLKCDGIFVEKMNLEGQSEAVTPADVREIKDYVAANRTLTTPFDIVVNGATGDLTDAQIQDKLAPWPEAGATWWVEGLWEATEAAAKERIRRGPPKLA